MKAILDHVGVSEKNFGESVQYHLEEPDNCETLQKKAEEAKIDNGQHLVDEDERKAYLDQKAKTTTLLSREEVLTA